MKAKRKADGNSAAKDNILCLCVVLASEKFVIRQCSSSIIFSVTPVQDSMKKPAASRTSATSELEFPPMHELVQKSIVGDAKIFQWAHRYAERIDEFLTSSNVTPHSWKGVQVSTEFSGTGCAEASFESAAIQAGFAPEDIHFRYAADIDKYCRRVIADSCPCFSCFNFRKQSQHPTFISM